MNRSMDTASAALIVIHREYVCPEKFRRAASWQSDNVA